MFNARAVLISRARIQKGASPRVPSSPKRGLPTAGVRHPAPAVRERPARGFLQTWPPTAQKSGARERARTSTAHPIFRDPDRDQNTCFTLVCSRRDPSEWTWVCTMWATSGAPTKIPSSPPCSKPSLSASSCSSSTTPSTTETITCPDVAPSSGPSSSTRWMLFTWTKSWVFLLLTHLLLLQLRFEKRPIYLLQTHFLGGRRISDSVLVIYYSK